MTSTTGYLLRRNAVFFVTVAVTAIVGLPLLAAGLIHSDVFITTAIFFLLVIGMDVLYGYTGLLSFGHIGFFAIGAYTVAILAKQMAMPFFPGALIALAINMLLGLILGRVLLRVSGLYFMLGTLSFGLMVHAVITVWYTFTGGDAGLGGIPKPSLGGYVFQSETAFGLLTWAIALALFWFAMNLTRSRVGRALRAIRSDEVSAACAGTHVSRLKMNMFALSAAYASIAGSLFAGYHGSVHPDSFSLAALLDVLLMLFFGGEGTIWGALIGAALIRALPDLSGPLHAGKILFSGLLFTVIIFAFPSGVGGGLKNLRQRLRRKKPPAAGVPRAAPAALPAPVHAATPGPALALDSVSRHFGGLRAVDDVSFTVERGQIKSLIGPNGAGKSTLINLISGVLGTNGGRIVSCGRPLENLRVDQIARLGVQRTFQHERLFAQLTVLENVMVGCEQGSNGSAADILRCGFALPNTLRAEQDKRAEAMRWLEVIGLADRADEKVTILPHGLRKLVEVARAAAARPSLLLLDETAAGLNDAEKHELKGLIRRLRDSGVTVLLIEHDMDFVMDLSDEVVVVSFGQRIANGTPDAVRQDPAVIAAYLGA